MKLGCHKRKFPLADYGGEKSALVAALAFWNALCRMEVEFDLKRGKARVLTAGRAMTQFKHIYVYI